jgi:transcriptional antiterminator RfaH
VNGYGWYVVQTKPRKESFVRDRIQDLGRETFLPLIAQRVRGRGKRRIGPLFPCYLFARLSEADGDLATVRWTHGVHRLLGDGLGPRAVGEDVVQTIRVRADRSGRLRFGRRLRAGDRVRILDGPFAGLIGTLEHPALGPSQRVSVLLDLFRRATRVQVGAHEIRDTSVS